MATLMVDGTPIAEIDEMSAKALKEFARDGIGLLIKAIESTHNREEQRDLYPLARGALVMRRRVNSSDVSIVLRFEASREKVENTAPASQPWLSTLTQA